MATNRNLRAAEPILSNSRQQFIQTLESKKQFEQDCAVIIPELDRLWKEKILTILGYTAEDLKQFPMHHPESGNNPFPFPVDRVINWKHYLFNYRPQLLSQAITRLASRIKMVDGEIHNSRGKVENLSAYYKSIVRDLRIKEHKKETHRVYDGPGSPQSQASKTETFVVGQLTPWGLVIATGRITIFGHPPAYVMDNGVLHKVECPKCFEEEGSYACVRPAHKPAGWPLNGSPDPQ